MATNRLYSRESRHYSLACLQIGASTDCCRLDMDNENPLSLDGMNLAIQAPYTLCVYPNRLKNPFAKK